jgi:hypothetical protein
MGTHVSVELDDYARQTYKDYVAADAELKEATARRDKARDALVTFLRLNEATAATDAGTPVVFLVESDRVTVDAPRLKAEEPFTYRRYSRVSHVEYLRLAATS